MMKQILDAQRCAIMERFEAQKGTLDGRPAAIRGRKLDFPSVVTIDGSNITAQFSWQTLDRVTKAGTCQLKS